MGLEAFEQNDPNISRDTTVQELINDVGESAAIRGLKYMYSLAEADENYKESMKPEAMEEGFREAGVEGENVTTASEKWARESNDRGIGINEDEE